MCEASSVALGLHRSHRYGTPSTWAGGEMVQAILADAIGEQILMTYVTLPLTYLGISKLMGQV